jgi:hypothetical protein
LICRGPEDFGEPARGKSNRIGGGLKIQILKGFHLSLSHESSSQTEVFWKDRFYFILYPPLR